MSPRFFRVIQAYEWATLGPVSSALGAQAMNDTSQQTFDEKQYSAHLSSQFECLWKHLEYTDTYVLKILGIYFAFSGLFVANINLFKGKELLASVLVSLASVVFATLLYRISMLLTELKNNIRSIDEEKHALHGGKLIHSVPRAYVESGLRTSNIGAAAVLLFAAAVVAYFFLQ